jgi:hypothetical protein
MMKTAKIQSRYLKEKKNVLNKEKSLAEMRTHLLLNLLRNYIHYPIFQHIVPVGKTPEENKRFEAGEVPCTKAQPHWELVKNTTSLILN